MSLTKTLRASKVGSKHIITPRLKEFLRANPNLVLEPWVADLIREQLVKQPRDRTRSFSSSAAGTCHRRQVFSYLGIETETVVSPQVQQIFYDGTWRHLRWQAVLLQAGIIDAIECSLPWPAMQSEGTMDGAGLVPKDHTEEQWQGLEFGWELKGINTYGYKKVEVSGPKGDHLSQVHRYFLSGGFDIFVIIYEDKNTQDWAEFVVTPDEARIAAQRQELEALNQYVERQEIPPMLPGCIDKTSTLWTKEYCPYAGDGGVCIHTNTWEDQ